MNPRKDSVLFVEPPPFDADIDKSFLATRGLEKILVVDERLLSLGRLNEKKLEAYERVFAADLNDIASLENTCEAILRAFNVVAVLGCSETSVLPAAWLAEKFAVSGIGIQVARLCRNKLAMMEKLSAAGIPCPATILVNRASIAADITDVPGEYPLICKPLMGFSSFGVVRVDSDKALETSIKQISRKSRFMIGRYYGLEDGNKVSEVLVQSYAPGVEIAVDGYVQRGKSHLLWVIDKPDVSAGPYFEDRSHIAPSLLNANSVRRIERLTQSCVEAIGLDDSPFHLEIRINGDQLHVLEIAARTGLIQSLRRARGIDPIAVALALKLEENPPVTPQWNRYAGSVCLSADRQGTFQALQNLDEIIRDPRIVAVRQLARPGQRVAPPPDMTDYIGIISATADTYIEVQNAINNARKTIKVVIA